MTERVTPLRNLALGVAIPMEDENLPEPTSSDPLEAVSEAAQGLIDDLVRNGTPISEIRNPATLKLIAALAAARGEE